MIYEPGKRREANWPAIFFMSVGLALAATCAAETRSMARDVVRSQTDPQLGVDVQTEWPIDGKGWPATVRVGKGVSETEDAAVERTDRVLRKIAALGQRSK